MSSRSTRKFIARTSSYYSFKEKTAVGQWVRKLNKKETTLDQVPEEIKKMILVDKPAVALEPTNEVKLEPAADVVAEEHVHDESCQHDDPIQQALVDGAFV